MQFTNISEILTGNKSGSVSLRGWVYRHRRTGENVFIIMRDGTGIIQCIVNQKKVDAKTWEDAAKLNSESSSLTLVGTTKKDERAPGGYELTVEKLDVVSFGEGAFPIQKDQSVEFLLDVRHLWVRSQPITNALKTRHYAIKFFREKLEKDGFIEVQTPIFTESACEGGAETFRVDYFGRDAYLSQSAQLYSEALIAGYPKVYAFTPSFRADPSRTPRHLTEFWGLEPEMAWYDFNDSLKLQEELVTDCVHRLAKEKADLLQFFKRDPKELLQIQPPFERLTYENALKILQKKGVQVKWGDPIGLDEEKVLVEGKTQPIFLVHLPKEIRAFYMKINPDDPRTVLDADMLAPEGVGEIIGGSEREWRYEELLKRMKEAGINKKDYEWYLDLRKYGSVPHSGFGLGIERFVRWVLKLESVRDTIPFPRNMTRLTP